MIEPRISISCSYQSNLRAPEIALIAERLGFVRIWLYDGPPAGGDIWVALARAAEKTSRIGLGAGVLVPSARHVMTNASAAATIEGLAPGRLTLGFGTGFGATLMLGQRPNRWDFVIDYVTTLRALLAGETVTYEGAAIRMLHPPGTMPARPISIPILIAANGPRGLKIAQELGDGVIGYVPHAEFARSVIPLHGTVLDEGETIDSPRVAEAAGVFVTMLFHSFYVSTPPGVDIDELPGGREWKAQIDASPQETRHLTLHESHLSGIAERDRKLVHPDSIAAFTFTGHQDDLRSRLHALADDGCSEVMFQPSGPDPERELRAFAEMAGLQHS